MVDDFGTVVVVVTADGFLVVDVTRWAAAAEVVVVVLGALPIVLLFSTTETDGVCFSILPHSGSTVTVISLSGVIVSV